MTEDQLEKEALRWLVETGCHHISGQLRMPEAEAVLAEMV